MCEFITDASAFEQPKFESPAFESPAFESPAFADSSQIRIIDNVPQYYYTGSSYRDRLKNGITLEYMFELEDDTRENLLSISNTNIIVEKEVTIANVMVKDLKKEVDELELNYDSDTEHHLSSKPKITVHKPKLVMHKTTTNNCAKVKVIKKVEPIHKEKVFEKKEKEIEKKKEKETKTQKRRYKLSKKHTLGNAYKLTVLEDAIAADKLDVDHPDFDKHKEEDILQELKMLWQHEQYDHDHPFDHPCDMDCSYYRRRIILRGKTSDYNYDWRSDMTDFYDDYGDHQYAWDYAWNY